MRPTRSVIALVALVALVVATAAHAQDSASATAASAADRGAVLATVQRFFDAMTRRDTAATRALLLPGSQLVATAPGATGAAPRVVTDSGYVALLAAGRERYLERIWTPTVLVRGAIAQLWAPYDFHIDGRFSHCGVDSFSLVRAGAEWRIAGVIYTAERTGCAPSPLGPPR